MLNVGIFCGGFSSEYEISLLSASTILNHFPKTYNPFLIQVSKEKWIAKYNDNDYDFNPWDLSFIVENNEVRVDVGLVYIHGNPGENGKIQALLELKGVPFVNSGALASELSFDKWFCNQFLNNFGVPVAKSVLLKSHHSIKSEEIINQLGLPCFVKPADSGSSYGISKVKTSEGLLPAIENAFKEGQTVVIESFLKGIEVTCGVYRTQEGLKALPLTEIVSENDFFDYEAKYLGKSKEITPARVSNEIKQKIQSRAKYIYDLLGLKSIARIDFMIVDDEPHVIEVNTTPGFSPASIVPQMLACEGVSITDFWKEIFEIELGV